MRYDLAVVGGGIVGSLTALRCADQGLRCIVIEAEDYHRSASANSAGGIYAQLNPQMHAAQDNAGHLLETVPFLKETTRAWLRLKQRLPELPLQVTGGMVVGCGDDDMHKLREKHYLEQSCGMRTQVFDRDQVRRLSPGISDAASGAIYSSDEGHCAPLTTLRLAQTALALAGVEMRTQTAVSAIERANGGSCLITSAGRELSAGTVVLACGAFLGRFLDGLHVTRHLTPLSIQMLAVSDSGAQIPFMTRRAGRKLSLKRVDQRRLWVGGGWAAQETPSGSWNAPISYENVRANLNEAIELFPGLAKARVAEIRSSRAAWTSDGLPMIGAVDSGKPGVFMAAGGNGYSLAPLYSELLCRLVLDQPTKFELSAYSPDRFSRNRRNNVRLVPD